jgi:hypothetical protein
MRYAAVTYGGRTLLTKIEFALNVVSKPPQIRGWCPEEDSNLHASRR